MNCKIKGGGEGKTANTGSSYGLATYLEHEDYDRLKNGERITPFFNLDKDSISKSQLVKDIDNNKAKLCKSDAKFYSIIISPSEKEQLSMGKTEKERCQNFTKFIRENVMQKYAESFNKGLSANDIKFYGKIHFDRDKSTGKGLNMHCHIIVSRKDQSNKLKISPQTTHSGKKAMGTVKSGFDKTEFYKNVEAEFDKAFSYQRIKEESFEYCNALKNGSIEDIKQQAIKNVQAELKQERIKEQSRSRNNEIKGGIEL
ncbi:clindamycin resistance transfer factor BtgB [Dysgonomonas sp. Marseille-P4677]|uniref:DUF5712 family protein n=1 Tax=Dysgonomonas sp. Marseille-P4677 TaxID=2364790 RepID=UPI001911E3B7|nr:DUF5712 family protein [Dysgonomonas sp. Marseille-P4677]MBK5719889.1 clindamycin resistance transfer factor BtgB [Dysgonomonas sp. Marseille-P4677]